MVLPLELTTPLAEFLKQAPLSNTNPVLGGLSINSKTAVLSDLTDNTK